MNERQAQLYADLCDVVERAFLHLPVDRGPDEPRGTSGYARAAANRIIGLIDQATEADIMQMIDERDEASVAADRLAEIVGAITGVDPGEHSSTNEPWLNAIVAGDSFLERQGFEYGVRLARRPAAEPHREGMTEAEAREFVDPANWEDLPQPLDKNFTLFVAIRRRRGPWQVVP